VVPHSDSLERLKRIALIYTEAYETVRRFDEYSSQNKELRDSILTDAAYFERVFASTQLDVQGTMIAEVLDDVVLPNAKGFRVYASTLNPPHPIYVLAVKSNGTIFRLRGFGATDFNTMVHGMDARPGKDLLSLVRLYYRLTTSFEPGPILDEAELRRTVETIRRVDAERDRERGQDVTPFLPQLEPGSESTVVRLCIFDASSSRLVIHKIKVHHNGGIDPPDITVLRDVYSAEY